jgi:hypothetical protein
MNKEDNVKEIHSLGFAEIIILRDDIAEVIVYEGVEMTQEMVHAYHTCLLNNLTAPFSLLINKVFSYTYDFQAQLTIAALPEIKAMAVVTYTVAAKASTESLAAAPRKVKWHIELFQNRESALSWLESEQNKTKTNG